MQKKLTPLNIAFLLLIIFFISGYVIYPLITLVIQSAEYFSSGKISVNEIFSGSVLNSVVLSVVTVAGSCIIGMSMAYFFHFRNFPLKNFLYTLFLIPVAAPPLVGVVAFLFLLNENGLLMRLIASALSMKTAPFRFDGWTAIIIVHIYSFYPFFLMFISSSLKKTDANLIDASHSLGASGTRTFFKVILPLLIPSVVGASLIVFMASMASFSAPFIFGGSIRFLTTEIYNAKINGDASLASLLSVVLTMISVLFLLALRSYRNRNAFDIKSKGTARISSAVSAKDLGVKGTLAVMPAAILVMLPVLAMIYLSFIPEGSLMRDYFRESFTFDNYRKVFAEPQFFEPFANSLKMSLIAVAITVIIGAGAAFLVTRKKLSAGNVLEVFLTLPYGIPGTVIALSFIISFSKPTIFTGYETIVGTFIILPLAYAVRNLPAVAQSSIAGFSSMDASLEEASSSLGASGFRTFRKIILPAVYPSVISGALLVFINSVGEFVSTILLYTFSTKTISVEIYSQLRLYNTGAAASYGVILFLMVMTVVYLTRKTFDRSVGAG